MIEQLLLKQLATKNQTTVKNVVREYFQCLFLSYFYQQKLSEKFFFKGGTALKIVFRSPRFSEDLDFTASGTFDEFEDILQETLLKIDREGIKTIVLESKKTSGGFFSIIETVIYKEKVEIRIQASKRKSKNIVGEKTVIINDFAPVFPLQILEKNDLFEEKIEALLDRRKLRDFFDLYFILRMNVKLPIIYKRSKDIIRIINSEKQDFSDLKIFLPHQYWPLIKDFKSVLLNEFKRHNF